MFKNVLLAAVSLVSLIIIFFAFWPVPYTKWSGLQLAYPSVNDEETLAEKLGYTRSDILLIIHADDLAIHKDQTDGALDAMQKVWDRGTLVRK